MNNDTWNPYITFAGNLKYFRNGQVWASFMIDPIHYPLTPINEKKQAYRCHKNFFDALPERFHISALHCPQDIMQLTKKTITVQENQKYPQYAKEVAQFFTKALNPQPTDKIGVSGIPTTRKYIISIPAGQEGLSEKFWSSYDEKFEVTALMPTDEDLLKHYDAGMKTINTLPKDFNPQPVNLDTHFWEWSHNLHRSVSPAPPPSNDKIITTPSHASLEEAKIKEHYTHIEIVDPQENYIYSYQRLFVIKSVSQNQLFPGTTEFLTLLDSFGFYVDYSMHCTKRYREKELKDTDNALTRLESVNQDIGAARLYLRRDLFRLAQSANMYSQIIEEYKGEYGINYFTVIAIGADSLEQLNDRTNKLKAKLAEYQIYIDTYFSMQKIWWKAMYSGIIPQKIHEEFSILQPAAHFATLVPFTTSIFGEKTGPIIGENHTSKFYEYFRMNPAQTIKEGNAQSQIHAGGLGAGKSVSVKAQAYKLYTSRGGRVAVIDKTRLKVVNGKNIEYMGEYEKFYRTIDPQYQVLSVLNATKSIDILRLFPNDPNIGTLTGDLLSQFLHIESGTLAETLLRECLSKNHRETYNIQSIPDLARYFIKKYPINFDIPEKEITPGVVIAAKFKVLLESDFAQSIFNDQLPLFNMYTQTLIFDTAGLQLPTLDEITNEHQYKELSLTKRFSHVMYGYIAQLVQKIFYSDYIPSLLIIDEAFHVTHTTIGQGIIDSFAREGSRKYFSSIYILTQNIESDIPEKIRSVVPIISAYATKDRTLAEGSIRAMGIKESKEPQYFEELTTKILNLSPKIELYSPEGEYQGIDYRYVGECLMKYLDGKIAVIKVYIPADENLFAAISTTPEEVEGGEEYLNATA